MSRNRILQAFQPFNSDVCVEKRHCIPIHKQQPLQNCCRLQKPQRRIGNKVRDLGVDCNSSAPSLDAYPWFCLKLLEWDCVRRLNQSHNVGMLMLSGEPLQALGNTNVPERYGLCAAAVLVLWLLCRISIILLQWIAQKPTALLLKHFSYRLLPAVLRWLDTTTLFDGLVIIIYVIVNILCAVVGTHSWSQINIRLGILATMNFLPLLAGMGFGPSADAVGVHRHVYTQAHRWIGRVCALQAVVHGSISLATSSKGSWSGRSGSIPLVVRLRGLRRSDACARADSDIGRRSRVPV